MRWPKYWSFSFSIIPSKEIPGLIFRMAWLDESKCYGTPLQYSCLENPMDGGSNQSILKEISPWCSLEGMMLKLKLQYFGHLMQRVDYWKRP